jgi:hypothetical protein
LDEAMDELTWLTVECGKQETAYFMLRQAGVQWLYLEATGVALLLSITLMFAFRSAPIHLIYLCHGRGAVHKLNPVVTTHSLKGAWFGDSTRKRMGSTLETCKVKTWLHDLQLQMDSTCAALRPGAFNLVTWACFVGCIVYFAWWGRRHKLKSV